MKENFLKNQKVLEKERLVRVLKSAVCEGEC